MAETNNSNADSRRIVVDLTLSIEEARKVIWQGRGPREPIGNLLDAKQLDYRDLAWAVNGAYSPQVRAAARTLLASWLGKPETQEITQRFGPLVVEGSHFLEDRWLLGFGQVAMAITGGFISIIWGLSSLANLYFQGQSTSLILINFFGFILVTVFIAYWGKRGFDDFVSYRVGHIGEGIITEHLRVSLDHTWTIFRNLHLPTQKSDLDIVLVGPGGVWLLEVKAYKATVRCIKGHWEQQKKSSWSRLRENPTRQVSNNAKLLNDYFSRQGIERWVDTAVALAQPQPIDNFSENKVPVWLVSTIDTHARNLTTRTPPTEAEIQKINSLLKELCQRQLTIEENK